MINALLKFLVIVSVCFFAGCSKEINEEVFADQSAEWISLQTHGDGWKSRQLKTSYQAKKTDSLTYPIVCEIKVHWTHTNSPDVDHWGGEDYSTANYRLGWRRPLGQDIPRWEFISAKGELVDFSGRNKIAWEAKTLGPEYTYTIVEGDDFVKIIDAYTKTWENLAKALKEQPIMGEDEIE